MGRQRFVSKDHRRLAKAIKPYGLYLHTAKSGHIQIMQANCVVWHMSGTPKNMHHAVDNTIKDLRRMGLVPAEFRL